MIVAVALYVYLPAALLTAALGGLAAFLLMLGKPAWGSVVIITRVALALLGVCALVCALIVGFDQRDWQHMYWAAQIPTLALLAGSGVVFCGAWRDGRARGPDPVWLLLAALWALALLPLALQVARPIDDPAPRNTEEPLSHTLELAAWGLGGALPEWLGSASGAERDVGYLPREVTLPFGTTITAAWATILVVAFALFLRALPAGHARQLCALCAPAPLVLLVYVLMHFRLFGNLDAAIWESDPMLLGSYGPTLVVAVIALGVLAAVFAAERARPLAARASR